MIQDIQIYPSEKLCDIIKRLLNTPLDNWVYDKVHSSENITSICYKKSDQEDKKAITLQVIHQVKKFPIIGVYFWDIEKHTRIIIYYNQEQEDIYNDLLNFIYNLIHLKNIDDIAYNTAIYKELETYF